jgi:hypothetical protein
MAYLKKFLLVFLVFSTLGYSNAWAFDEHVLEQLETEITHLNAASGDSLVDPVSEDQNNSEIACDHCCHISSHLVAIFFDPSSTATAGSAVYSLSLTEGLNSFIPGPDLEPPRV